jgi:hypothetical protein
VVDELLQAKCAEPSACDYSMVYRLRRSLSIFTAITKQLTPHNPQMEQCCLSCPCSSEFQEKALVAMLSDQDWHCFQFV